MSFSPTQASSGVIKRLPFHLKLVSFPVALRATVFIQLDIYRNVIL
jgi:hypothetical protein